MDYGIAGVVITGLFTVIVAIVKFSPLVAKRNNNPFCKEHEKIVYQANQQDKDIKELKTDTKEIKGIVIRIDTTLKEMKRK